jgi:hypothetical protein
MEIDTIVEAASTTLVATRTASLDSNMFGLLHVAERIGDLGKSAKPTATHDGCQIPDI